jgi:ABC-type nickel/cobalt efflux system permease component RcnA
MWGLLGFAVILGMRHAMEPDHVAAVSSLAADRKKLPEVVAHGLTWGLGHSLTLLIFSGIAIALGKSIPDSFGALLDDAVGVMLIGLGLNVIWRLWKERVHFHSHRHGDGVSHFHAHSHAGERLGHVYSLHAHEHKFKWRSLLVGMTHGMSGSGALLVLAASKVSSVVLGVGYVLMFGLGSIVGMGLMSAVVSVPLILSAKFLTFANRWFQGAIGALTIVIGFLILFGELA